MSLRRTCSRCGQRMRVPQHELCYYCRHDQPTPRHPGEDARAVRQPRVAAMVERARLGLPLFQEED